MTHEHHDHHEHAHSHEHRHEDLTHEHAHTDHDHDHVEHEHAHSHADVTHTHTHVHERGLGGSRARSPRRRAAMAAPAPRAARPTVERLSARRRKAIPAPRRAHFRASLTRSGATPSGEGPVWVPLGRKCRSSAWSPPSPDLRLGRACRHLGRRMAGPPAVAPRPASRGVLIHLFVFARTDGLRLALIFVGHDPSPLTGRGAAIALGLSGRRSGLRPVSSRSRVDGPRLLRP